MKNTLFIAIAILTIATASTINAQQPAKSATISVQTIVAPGTSVLRHTFNSTSSFFDTAINDSSEIAFISRWIDRGPGGGVFTNHRIVSMEGTTIDGKYICLIQPESRISINAAGEVAWTGWYAPSKGECSFGVVTVTLGLFVDSRFVKNVLFDPLKDAAYPFISLSDDGQASVSQTPRNACTAAAPAAPQRGMGIPGIGGAIGAAAQAAQRGVIPDLSNLTGLRGGRPPLPPALCADPMLSMLAFNSKGQFVIPINTPAGGLLLLGTKNGR